MAGGDGLTNALVYKTRDGENWVFRWDDSLRSFTNLLLTIQSYADAGDMDRCVAEMLIESASFMRADYAKSAGLVR